MRTTKENCIFCGWDDPVTLEIFAENERAYAKWDKYPHAAGHALIVPKTHRENIFELSDEEVIAIQSLLRLARNTIDEQYDNAMDYNVLSNIGAFAGQKVMHAHVHLIPRQRGDTPIILGDPNKPDHTD